MLWVTRSRIRVNRAATGWLVRRFVDPEATFCFLDPAEVARIQEDLGAIGFDAPGATYPHKDGAGRCSFEALAQQYRADDGALQHLARIVHCADFAEVPGPEGAINLPLGTFDTVSLVKQLRPRHALLPEAAGLRAISRGFPLVATDDHETLERSAFLYDALYASIRNS
jgi:hypothetical protein